MQWQHIETCLPLPDVADIALKLGNKEGEAGDLGGKTFDLDAVKIGELNPALLVLIFATLDDLGFDFAHLDVGDDEEVPRAAGWVEDTDVGHALAQVEQFAWIVSGLFEFLAQVIEEQRIEHLEDIWNACVVHSKRAALVVVSDCLDH